MSRLVQVVLAAAVGLSFASVGGCAEQPAPKRQKKKKGEQKAEQEAEQKAEQEAEQKAEQEAGK